MAVEAPLTDVTCEADPDHPGWLRWRMADEQGFNETVLGHQLVRLEEGGTCRHRIVPQRMHTNVAGNLHGAVLLAMMDVSMFSTLYLCCGVDAGRAVTLDMQSQFISPGDAARPLDALVEVLRETRRMAFMRGLLVQDEDLVASFLGTVRKPSSSR